MDNLKELERIIKAGDITTVFQPIVSLSDGSTIGYEALSRGPKDSTLQYPDKLFESATIHNRLWDLESLCRSKAIEKSINIDKSKFLFLNVDPFIIKDEKFHKGFTKEFLSKYNISPKSIIFEITEKTAIEDYKSFKATLNNYVEQGYKIAIDDTGAGYSGLKTLSETRPHFVKIDMDIIRDIHLDKFKQALIKTFVTFTEETNMKLIAEGIEKEEELNTLIDLGVYAGQGYLLQRPAGTFLDISENLKNFILQHNKLKRNKLGFNNNHIGDIARREYSFDLNIICEDLKLFFNNNNTKGTCIVKNNHPVGLLMKHSLDSVLATQYGVAVFSKRPVSLVMDMTPLVVDYYTSVKDVSIAAMKRTDNNTYDHIIVTKDGEYYGIVTVKDLLEHTTAIETKYARELNPLTGLPGNTIIESILSDMTNFQHKSCVLYFDLDNFKMYNDTYGFENGDKIIKFTSELIQKKIKDSFPYNSFIGHIGGDDFVAVIEASYDSCKFLCSDIINYFDKNVLDFFNEKDKTNGYVESLDRKGESCKFPLTSMSIAGIYGYLNTLNDMEEIGLIASQIKKKAKKIPHSSYIIETYLTTIK